MYILIIRNLAPAYVHVKLVVVNITLVDCLGDKNQPNQKVGNGQRKHDFVHPLKILTSLSTWIISAVQGKCYLVHLLKWKNLKGTCIKLEHIKCDFKEFWSEYNSQMWEWKQFYEETIVFWNSQFSKVFCPWAERHRGPHWPGLSEQLQLLPKQLTKRSELPCSSLPFFSEFMFSHCLDRREENTDIIVQHMLSFHKYLMIFMIYATFQYGKLSFDVTRTSSIQRFFVP